LSWLAGVEAVRLEAVAVRVVFYLPLDTLLLLVLPSQSPLVLVALAVRPTEQTPVLWVQTLRLLAVQQLLLQVVVGAAQGMATTQVLVVLAVVVVSVALLLLGALELLVKDLPVLQIQHLLPDTVVEAAAARVLLD